MTGPSKPEDSITTALAVTKDDMNALSPAQRAEIARRKNANIVAAQIAGTNWGQGLDQVTQRAVADWGQRHGVDVTTEIFVLGGNIYLSAQLYINRGVDLINAGKLLDYHQKFIHHDPQLDEILREVLPPTATDAERAELARHKAAALAEIRERRELRIKHGVPNDPAIKAAVLTTIVLAKLPHTPFCGVKWTPHPNKKSNDPVGTDYPQETALTRSARRAWKQVIRQVPEMQRWIVGADEDAMVHVETLLQEHEARKAAAIAEPQTKMLTEGPVPVAEYVRSSAEGAEPLTPEQVAAFSSRAIDPYAAKGTEHIATPFDPDPKPIERPKPPTGPVSHTLFGTTEPVEMTADERAAWQARVEAEIAADEEAMLERESRRAGSR